MLLVFLNFCPHFPQFLLLLLADVKIFAGFLPLAKSITVVEFSAYFIDFRKRASVQFTMHRITINVWGGKRTLEQHRLILELLRRLLPFSAKW